MLLIAITYNNITFSILIHSVYATMYLLNCYLLSLFHYSISKETFLFINALDIFKLTCTHTTFSGKC
jgi:hypothetical protein